MDVLQEKQDILIELEARRRRNPLKYHKLMPRQAQFKDDPATTKCEFGGNRSGKSEGGADVVLDRGLSKPNQRIWVVGETFQDSIAIQQRKIWNLVPKHRIIYGRYDPINGFTNRKLLLDNGTLVTFKSYDQGVKVFQSDDIDLIWNDEEPPIEIYKEQRVRLIDRNGQMIITMTSLKGITELVEEVFDDYDVEESQYAPLVDEDLPRVVSKDGIKIYFLWTTENPHINQDRLLEETRMMTKQEIKSRVYGIPINLTGKIYMSFTRDVHVVEGIEDMPEGHYSLYHVLDPHDRKPWAMIWAAVHKTGSVYVVDEYPFKNFNEMDYDDKTYEDYAALIKKKDAELKELFGVKYIQQRIIDPNFGNKTVKKAEREGGQSSTTPKRELEKRGLFYDDGIDTLEAGHIAVRNALHYEIKGNDYVVRPNQYICSNCSNTIRHLSRYSRKDINAADGDVKDKPGVMEKYKDFADCVRYLIMANPKYYGAQIKPVKGRKKY